jgi:hypothetical protein
VACAADEKTNILQFRDAEREQNETQREENRFKLSREL